MLLTSRGADNDSFFLGERKSPWYLVAFGMIGASLSGVTFVSVPGWVGNPDKQFAYMQMVLGYTVGYFIVAYVLLPIYYKLNLTSIYEYLGSRFGPTSHKTGSVIFLGSRVLGASIRLLLVANILQAFIFDDFKIPFEATVIFSVVLIWLYTNKGGIKTIIWTDTLQTAFMIGAVVLAFYVVGKELDLFNNGVIKTIRESNYSKTFFFGDSNGKTYFWKMFLGGIFITIGMTGLDQDMMQKNLTCKSLKDAQKNMLTLSIVLIFINLLFLSLGALLYMYAEKTGIGLNLESSDSLFPTIALASKTGLAVGVLFLIGLIAAAYSSADSALTSLTTSVSHDIFDISKIQKVRQKSFRQKIHIVVSVVIILTVIILHYNVEGSALGQIMFFAGLTYGPLIGLFFFGIFTKRNYKDVFTPIVCLISVIAVTLLQGFSTGGRFVDENALGILGEYQIGDELIIINSILTFSLLYLVSCIKPRAIG